MMPKKKTYDEVLAMLREQQHRAPEGWEEIAEALDFAEHFTPLKTHRVTKDLWGGIEEALSEEMPVETKSKWSVRQMWPRYAAAMLLLIGLSYGLLETSEKNYYAYHSEVEYGEILEVDEDLEDLTFSKGKTYLSENSFLFKEEKLTEYQVQLEELETAIAEVQNLQEQYGVDASGIKLLAKMERQKATLIKSMINQP